MGKHQIILLTSNTQNLSETLFFNSCKDLQQFQAHALLSMAQISAFRRKQQISVTGKTANNMMKHLLQKCSVQHRRIYANYVSISYASFSQYFIILHLYSSKSTGPYDLNMVSYEIPNELQVSKFLLGGIMTRIHGNQHHLFWLVNIINSL